MAEGGYRERPASRDAGLPGAVVWEKTAVADRVGRVLPDGCMDLIWDGERLLVAGPDTRAHLVAGVAGARYTGLRFAPGFGPLVYGLPADELTDRRVGLDEVWPGRLVRELTERVAGAARTGAALEAVAAGRLAAAPPGPEPEPWRARAVAALAAGRGVAGTARELGLSERQLRRRSLAAFGYGPKTLARVLRLGRALRLTDAGTPPAEAAALAGYADQAHLAREVRELAGVPLTRLRG
ncbi:helix-turn-helix domain-containing protein [Streptomyces millisiae]|uniref:Helix-turn-helix domain-containing protein n=1 Tax=Streptomyces millisiae TaxID=3075542 RepID=A0ABU2LRA6_9ACTN|nr:helix-turn-helix domain-containing protein [Streptomyces sp. DSM 44918]MDT0320129.1 helix-turn-helix domain-containing protein [Streptomyces sp. DSM 44918]